MQTRKFFRRFSFSNSKTFYPFLFILCIISRLLTSINYLEDIDSMRFALSLFDYDISKLRPHFPGYPVFCFFTKIIYFFTGSVKISFSIIGGISTFLIIYFSNLILEKLTTEKTKLLSILLFLNPFLWILGNRYMSDIFGLSILMMIVYFTISGITSNNRKQFFLAFFLIGIMSGVRVAFIPFIIPLLLYVFIYSKIVFFKCFFIMFLGIIVWLIPLTLITGLNDFYAISINHIFGHFFKWGGSVITSDFSYIYRMTKIAESLWADCLGGYWDGRNPLTLILSLGWIFSIYSFYKSKKIIKGQRKKILKIIILSALVYLIWIFFFQNIVYKPRHVIPLLPFILMLISIGFDFILNLNKSLKIYVYGFFCCLFTVTSYLCWQHKSPSAISQAKSYIINDNTSMKIFCSTSLINSYIKKHKGSENIIFAIDKDEGKVKRYYNLGYTVYSTKDLKSYNMQIEQDSFFYHNPYVNRLWSTIRIYKYKKPNFNFKI